MIHPAAPPAQRARARRLRPAQPRIALLVFLGACVLLPPHPITAGGGRPKASLQLHFEVSPTLPESQRTVYHLQNPKVDVAVGKFPELWDKHMIGAEALPGNPGAVLLRFNDHGKRVLHFLTDSNRGRRLVVVLNGRPIFAPTVDATLPNGQLVVPSGISPEEFESLQRMAKKNKRQDEAR